MNLRRVLLPRAHAWVLPAVVSLLIVTTGRGEAEPPVLETARQVGRWLAQQQYDEIRRVAEEDFRQRLTDALLAERWSRLAEFGGDFRNWGEPRMSDIEEQVAVVMPGTWERAKVDLVLIFAPEGSLRLLSFVPQEAPRPVAHEDPALIARAAQMRQILNWTIMYASDHQDRLPPDLDALRDYLPEEMDPETLQAFRYHRPAERWSRIREPNETPLLFERQPLREDGHLVGFVSGHVEIIPDPAELQRLLPGGKPAPMEGMNPARSGQ
jgi:hypothetical protein